MLSYFYGTLLLNFKGKLGKCLVFCDFSPALLLKYIPKLLPLKCLSDSSSLHESNQALPEEMLLIVI